MCWTNLSETDLRGTESPHVLRANNFCSSGLWRANREEFAGRVEVFPRANANNCAREFSRAVAAPRKAFAPAKASPPASHQYRKMPRSSASPLLPILRILLFVLRVFRELTLSPLFLYRITPLSAKTSSRAPQPLRAQRISTLPPAPAIRAAGRTLRWTR